MAEKLLAHNVYFTLKDPSAEAKQTLISACHKYLTGHEGVVFYAAGGLEKDLVRDVNDRDFHVALHVVFKDRKAHDNYQKAERHLAFIEESRSNWAQVRVFDSLVSQGAE
jgi:hypothetical protein